MSDHEIDPLTMRDGSPVADAQGWSRRAAELRELFQDEVYGRLPDAVPWTWQPRAEADDLCRGAVHYHGYELTLEVGAGRPVPISVALFVPAGSARPPPLFLVHNATGNRSLIDHPAILDGPGIKQNVHSDGEQYFAPGECARAWPIADICTRGYALATYSVHDTCSDHPDNPSVVRDQLGTHDGHHWGALACWAWTLMRVRDALADCPLVDAERCAVSGMSRRGKAALLAGAFDERFKLVIPHQSGTGGTALSCHDPAESIESITRVFPHWFAPRFASYGDDPQRLPVDQHLLISLCAPRSVLSIAGDQDQFASPALADRALQLAAPTWRILGIDNEDGLYRDRLPAPPLPPLMQLWRDVEHQVDAEFWRGYLDAADAIL